MKVKVFCIGFHKTGTTSLGSALELLNYRVVGEQGVYDPYISKNVLAMAHSLVGKYDAFQDNPWPIIFREMDEAYPGSKFILSVRDSHSWIQSQVKFFGRKETPMREWIYGCGSPVGNEEIYIKRYEEHNAVVRAYFGSRPNDLLEMDLSKGDGWECLCTFLGCENPGIPFPHANKGRGDRAQGRPNCGFFSKLLKLGRRNFPRT